MSYVALALLVGLLAIAFAILRVAQKLDAMRVTSIEILNAAVASYAAAHKLAVVPSGTITSPPPPTEVEYENKPPRLRWTPPEEPEEPRGPKGGAR